MIKSFSLSKIFNNTKEMLELINKMEFKEQLFGDEPVNFKILPDDLISMLNSFNEQIQVNVEESGIFRKPKNIIHCENVPAGLIFIGICAIAPTTITFYKHLKSESENAFEINVPVNEIIEDAIFPDAWEETNKEVLKEGEMFFFSPALWHKIDSDLIQVQYLYLKENKEPEYEI